MEKEKQTADQHILAEQLHALQEQIKLNDSENTRLKCELVQQADHVKALEQDYENASKKISAAELEAVRATTYNYTHCILQNQKAALAAELETRLSKEANLSVQLQKEMDVLHSKLKDSENQFKLVCIACCCFLKLQTSEGGEAMRADVIKNAELCAKLEAEVARVHNMQEQAAHSINTLVLLTQKQPLIFVRNNNYKLKKMPEKHA